MCNILKKAICIFLSILIIISSVGYLFANASQQNTAEISAERFALEIGNMINSSETVNKIISDDCSYDSVNNEFSTARLIVKSKKKINKLKMFICKQLHKNGWILLSLKQLICLNILLQQK